MKVLAAIGIIAALGVGLFLVVDGRAQIATLEQRNAKLAHDNGELQEQVDRIPHIEANLAEVKSELAEARALVAEIQDWEAARNRYATLQEDIADANEDIADANKEIIRLRGERRALIPATEREGFRCTGSMEPKITCLDEATAVTNVREEDIVVGSVVVFRTDTCENQVAPELVHRVISITYENGQPFYEMQGDNTEEPDGCRAPLAHIKAYIIELHKNVNTRNTALRYEVNTAKANYETAVDRYDHLRSIHCPGVPRGATCITAYHGVFRAYADYEYYGCVYDRMLGKARSSNPHLYPEAYCSRPIS